MHGRPFDSHCDTAKDSGSFVLFLPKHTELELDSLDLRNIWEFADHPNTYTHFLFALCKAQKTGELKAKYPATVNLNHFFARARMSAETWHSLT